MAGSCCKFADAEVEVELGREIGSVTCGRIWGSSMMIIGAVCMFRRIQYLLWYRNMKRRESPNSGRDLLPTQRVDSDVD